MLYVPYPIMVKIKTMLTKMHFSVANKAIPFASKTFDVCFNVVFSNPRMRITNNELI